MSSLTLESGMRVSSCAEYEQARAAFRISETLANQIISAEYLRCSLSLDLQVDEQNTKTMRAIFHQLELRALPTSLGPSTERGKSLSQSGFQLWLERSMLTYNDEFTDIQIQYKGKLRNGNHLIWVADKATQGNYVSYFPAIVLFDEEQAVVGAAPIYASGF
ncbi:hypothetical protein PN836_010415 [Ningiella sp. W23]|uniref:hypothetical protein n=1 Tax=Ningiella sp. W23 TaxID=3023715 RepID=UPI003757DCDB